MQYREWSIFEKNNMYYAYLGEEMLVMDSLVELFNVIDDVEDEEFIEADLHRYMATGYYDE